MVRWRGPRRNEPQNDADMDNRLNADRQTLCENYKQKDTGW